VPGTCHCFICRNISRFGSPKRTLRALTAHLYLMLTTAQKDEQNSKLTSFFIPPRPNPSIISVICVTSSPSLSSAHLCYVATVNTSKAKGKVQPITCLNAQTQGVEICLHSFLNSALDKGGRSTERSDRFIPGQKYRYPLNRRLGGHQGRSGRV
jgi:hypothetical protein